MNPFARLRLAVTLPAAIGLLALCGMAATGAVGLLSARSDAREEGLSSLAAAADAARLDVAGWLDDRRGALVAAAADPSVARFMAMRGDPRSPAAPRADDGGDPGLAATGAQQDGALGDRDGARDRLDATFRGLVLGGGLADLILMTLEGEVIHSLQPPPGSSADLRDGPAADSPLGAAFRQAAALQPGATAVADLDPLGSDRAAYIATPVAGGSGRVAGVLAARLPPGAVGDLLRSVALPGTTADLYVVGADALARSPSRVPGRLDAFAPPPALPQVEAAAAGREGALRSTTGLGGRPAMAVVHPLGLDGLRWSIVAERDLDDLSAATALRRNLSVLGVAGALVAAVLAWAIARSVTAPLAALASAAAARDGGDGPIPCAARGDEVGDLARATGHLREELRRLASQASERAASEAGRDRILSDLGAALGRLAEGDLTRSLDTPLDGAHERLRQDVNAAMAHLSSTLALLVDSAAQIAQKAQEIGSASEDLSRRTESQAATLEETAAALDELTASVKSSAQGAAEVDEVVDKARSEAEQSGAVVRDAVAAMAEIERSSNEISQIIGVIDDIAFQTNLLALNAGVEAARAGEAGKGFAVVASEVRTLAQRSADAAKQIKVLIGGSAQHVRQGVDLVGRAGEALTSIVDRVAHIAELVSDIASGAKEQAIGLSEINGGVNQLDQVTQQNAAMVERFTPASQSLTEDARWLAEVVGRFRLQGTGSAGAAPAPGPARHAPSLALRVPVAPAPVLEATTGRPVADAQWTDF